MTIYETENQEIIDLNNLYIEVKTFILKFENLKLLFKEHHNLKQTKSYTVFEGSTSSYQNFLKVYKIFISGINTIEYQKYLNQCQIYNDNYCLNFVDGKLYKRTEKLMEHYELKNCSPTSIFEIKHIKLLKKILNVLIITKLNNITIESL